MKPLSELTYHELRALLRDTPVGNGFRFFGILDELLRREREAMKDRCIEELDDALRTLIGHAGHGYTAETILEQVTKNFRGLS